MDVSLSLARIRFVFSICLVFSCYFVFILLLSSSCSNNNNYNIRIASYKSSCLNQFSPFIFFRLLYVCVCARPLFLAIVDGIKIYSIFKLKNFCNFNSNSIGGTIEASKFRMLYAYVCVCEEDKEFCMISHILILQSNLLKFSWENERFLLH